MLLSFSSHVTFNRLFYSLYFGFTPSIKSLGPGLYPQRSTSFPQHEVLTGTSSWYKRKWGGGAKWLKISQVCDSDLQNSENTHPDTL